MTDGSPRPRRTALSKDSRYSTGCLGYRMYAYRMHDKVKDAICVTLVMLSRLSPASAEPRGEWSRSVEWGGVRIYGER